MSRFSCTLSFTFHYIVFVSFGIPIDYYLEIHLFFYFLKLSYAEDQNWSELQEVDGKVCLAFDSTVNSLKLKIFLDGKCQNSERKKKRKRMHFTTLL